MRPKLIGCCSCCDTEVFKITHRDESTQQPIKVGAPHDDAMRATFLLVDGSIMNLTFCAECAETLEPAAFPILWNRCLASWVKQSGSDHQWVSQQRHNGILGMLRIVPWKDI